MDEPVAGFGTSPPDRELRLGRAFVALADTLTSDFDVIELLQLLVDSCAELLDTAASGLLLLDGQGRLQLVASTSEAADLVELVQISAQAGPCFDSFTSGRTVSAPDLSAMRDRWPEFVRAALDCGFASVHATPMRLRQQVIGTMNLLDTRSGPLSDADAAAAQALADVATIGVLQSRVIRQSQVVTEQLQAALSSRVVIEQAKGVLAATNGLPVDAAFEVMRDHARRTNTPLRLVASEVVSRRLDLPSP